MNLHRIQYETWLPRRETSLSLDIRKFLGSIKVTRISYKGMLSLYGGNFVDIFSAKKGVVVLAPKPPFQMEVQTLLQNNLKSRTISILTVFLKRRLYEASAMSSLCRQRIPPRILHPSHEFSACIAIHLTTTLSIYKVIYPLRNISLNSSNPPPLLLPVLLL